MVNDFKSWVSSLKKGDKVYCYIPSDNYKDEPIRDEVVTVVKGFTKTDDGGYLQLPSRVKGVYYTVSEDGIIHPINGYIRPLMEGDEEE